MSVPEGVIVYDNINGQMPLGAAELMGLFESGDRRVRFIEKGFQTGEMTLSKFLDNPYTLAQVGGDMIPILERVAMEVNKSKAHVFSPSERVSFLKYTIISGSEEGFKISGGCNKSSNHGYASGLLKIGEAA